MIIKIFVCGPIQNNTIVLICEKTDKAAVIDPSFGSFDKVASFLSEKKCTLDKILLTHAHWDHMADLKLFKDRYHSRVYIHRLDAEDLEHPRSSGFFSISVQGVKPDVLLEDKQKLNIGELQFLVLHTPGHTLGSVCFYFEKEKKLFSGDTLFKGSFGRVDFSNSDPEKMIKSLKMLASLPGDTKIYPGHGKETTLAKENWIKEAEKFV